jgi:hypothetical protein
MNRQTMNSIAPLLTTVLLGLTALATPAHAQWSRVTALPARDIFTVFANDDTIVAAADTLAFVSTDAGVTFHPTTKPAVGVRIIQAVRLRNGRLFVGTGGQGVFVSDNLGVTWQAFNQGLVGGLFNSQLDVSNLEVRGDSLFAGTFGAGVYVRGFSANAWQHFGEVFEENQASNIDALVVGGTRLLAAGGANGQVFFRDPGAPEWTLSSLDNVGLHPGMQARQAVWNGHGFVVGTNLGAFRSATGQEPWARFDPQLGAVNNSSFAARSRELFAAFDIVNAAVIEQSSDDGASWHVLESLPNVFVYRLAMSHNDLYAGRADGLWRRPTGAVSVPIIATRVDMGFGILGRQPVGNNVRLRFDLPQSGNASIEFFDVMGRRASAPLEQSWSAGPHVVSFDASQLSAGVYQARLTSSGRSEVVRLVHTR